MELLTTFFDFLLHIDRYLVDLVAQYPVGVYGILFLIIFAETGLVVFPFLPGDSILFAAGALVAKPDSPLHLWLLLLLLMVAAIFGDFINYAIGQFFGLRLFREDSRFFKPQSLARTQDFYAKYGNKTIVYARFVPIVRTFAPFVAGIGKMPYRHFVLYNALGGILWVSLFILAGYLFGQISWIKNNFSLVVLCIVLASAIPPLLAYFNEKKK